MRESVVCALGDIQLIEHDLSLLAPRRWFNDQLIAYYFEHITSLVGMRKCLLLEPSIIYSASYLQDDH